ncbi:MULTISPECIES: hypothetical protein [Rhodococcus]|nr:MULTISPECIES: hypothetical protein [Rhodococcus]
MRETMNTVTSQYLTSLVGALEETDRRREAIGAQLAELEYVLLQTGETELAAQVTRVLGDKYYKPILAKAEELRGHDQP